MKRHILPTVLLSGCALNNDVTVSKNSISDYDGKTVRCKQESGELYIEVIVGAS